MRKDESWKGEHLTATKSPIFPSPLILRETHCPSATFPSPISMRSSHSFCRFSGSQAKSSLSQYRSSLESFPGSLENVQLGHSHDDFDGWFGKSNEPSPVLSCPVDHSILRGGASFITDAGRAGGDGGKASSDE